MSELSGDLGVLRALSEMYGLDNVVKKIDEGAISEKNITRGQCSNDCTYACANNCVLING